MTTKQVVVYPSPENVQRTNDVSVPLQWAIEYLRKLRDSIPADERETAALANWSSLQVVYEHTLTPEEVFQEKVTRARKLLGASLQEAMPADRVREIYKLLTE